VIEFNEKGGAVTFAVRVIPRSSKTVVVGELDGALKVKLKSPPVDGAANEELIRFLAKELSVSKASIVIISGQTSRTKRVSIEGISAHQFTSILQPKI
jgi:uncharacterized protein (TIGR00251 family)